MSTVITSQSEKKLPSLQDLHYDVDVAFKNDQLNLLLNQQPPAKWIKKNPFANNTDYIPIDKVEFLMTKIFQKWRIEVLSYSQIFNAVSVHVRLHYCNPLTGDWSYQDGLGAVQIQTKQGSSPADLGAINNNAVQMALPAAESYAFKDAAEKLGSLFGANLNRKDVVGFAPSYSADINSIKAAQK